MKRTNTRYMIQLTLLIAIQIIMGAVPGLGLIPVTPVFNLTTLHIPVIVGAAVLGVKAGAVLGLTFGLTSMIRAIYVPTIFNWPFNPAATGSFYSVLIAIVPRVALGILAAYVFILLSKRGVKSPLCAGIAGVAGSLCNTVLVLGGIYLLFGQSYSAMRGMSPDALLALYGSVVVTNGIPEAIAAAVVCAALVVPLRRIANN